MKRLPNFREIYRGVRKPTPPPTRVEQDRRGRMKREEDAEEIRKHTGRRRGELYRDEGREEKG